MEVPKLTSMVKVVPVEGSKDFGLVIYVATDAAREFVEAQAPKFGNCLRDTAFSTRAPYRFTLYACPTWPISEVVEFLESYGKGD